MVACMTKVVQDGGLAPDAAEKSAVSTMAFDGFLRHVRFETNSE